ncbi:hypothetical protein HDU91_002312, partial [Kappamyces sp. JEL0680]
HSRSHTLYDSEFQHSFLQSSKDFFARESSELLKTAGLDCHGYLETVQRRLSGEELRIETVLVPKTRSELIGIVETEMLENHLATLIERPNSGVVPMITQKQYSSLGLMYKLFGRVPSGHAKLKCAVADHVRTLGKSLDQPEPSLDSEKTKATPPYLTWVESILSLKSIFDQVLNVPFASDVSFEAEINAAIQELVNANTKAAEFISLYIDHYLRLLAKDKIEQDFELTNEKAITLFRYLIEKDVFERYYKNHLAKRLLYLKSIAEDAEKSILSRLKVRRVAYG